MTDQTLSRFQGCGEEGEVSRPTTLAFLPVYLLLGTAFGFVLARSEVLSWFRIQEMFRFQSFRMYGIIGSAVVTASISLLMLRGLKIGALTGETISIPQKTMGSGIRYLVGGAIFGVGWALTCACPGPLIALIGNGVTVMIVAVLSALIGTWVYAWLRPRLPQ
jgi:uncharacterized protein